MNMTLNELAAELGLSPCYLRSQFSIIRRRLFDRGIDIYKIGRGKYANYGIRNYEDINIRWEPDARLIPENLIEDEELKQEKIRLKEKLKQEQIDRMKESYKIKRIKI